MIRCRTRTSAKESQAAQPVGKELPQLRGTKRTRSPLDWNSSRRLERSSTKCERNAGASHQHNHESDVLEDKVPPRRCSDLLKPSWRLPLAKRAHGVQQMQRPTPKQREQGAIDSGSSPKGQCRSNGALAKRDTCPHGHQRGANRPVAKAKSTRHGSRRRRAPDSTSAIVCAKSAIGFTAEKEEKSTRGASEKPRPPRKNSRERKAAPKSLTARTPL